MKLLPILPFALCNRAMLRAAAALVPRSQREEWHKEWQSELWHVRDSCCTRHTEWQSEKEVAAFCFGAFQDAFHLHQHARENLPKTRSLSRAFYSGSALHSLALLAFLAAAAFAVSNLLPGTRLALQPSPYRDPEHLLVISSPHSTQSAVPTIHADQFRIWAQRRQHLFSSFAFYQPQVKPVTLSTHPSAELTIARASSNLFDLLGIHIPLDPIAQGEMPALVITREALAQYFSEDRNITGQIVRIGLRKAKVVAVIPAPRWTLPGHMDAWLLEPDQQAAAIPDNARGFLVARLNPLDKNHLTDQWDMSAPTPSGAAADFTCASLTLPSSTPRSIFLFTFFLSLLALPATTSLPLGEYPANHHKPYGRGHLLRWIFLTAKFALILPILYFGSLDLAYLNPSIDPVTSQYIQIVTGFCTSLFALRWMLRDQRQRCPVCLGKLTNPARVGQPSRNFLGWNGTELICIGGHGLLHVPEIQTSWFSTQRWLYLDPSWDVLFSEPHLAPLT
ncbi:MAG: hypothetical protein JWM43_3062 [Acidobacteriaceae bacterium]|nr:hypothetical protein [Acidobacteriaceae bacterium]